MRALSWNTRGFDARGRRDQLRDVVRGNNVDIVGLVETLKNPSLLISFLRLRVLKDLTIIFYLLLDIRVAPLLVLSVAYLTLLLLIMVSFRLVQSSIIVKLMRFGKLLWFMAPLVILSLHFPG